MPDFPIVLEAYRKVLTDVLDVAALRAVLGGIADGTIAVERRLVDAPSPAASAVLFGYVASFMYEGDAPPLERRAAALAPKASVGRLSTAYALLADGADD